MGMIPHPPSVNHTTVGDTAVIFKCTPWLDAAIDMANDNGDRLEWERVGMKYHVSLFTRDEQHDEKATSLDGAAFGLVQRLRPTEAPDGPVAA